WIFVETADVRGVIPIGGDQEVLTTFTYKFVNHGNTPARLTATAVTALPIKSKNDLPSPPAYAEMTEYPQSPIGPGQFHTVFVNIGKPNVQPGDRLKISCGELILCTFGIVEFLDIYNRKHYTRFCHRYQVSDVPGRGRGMMVQQWGPEE